MNEADLDKADVPFGQPSSDMDVHTGSLLMTLLGVVKFRLEIRYPRSFMSAVFDELAARGQVVHALIG